MTIRRTHKYRPNGLSPVGIEGYNLTTGAAIEYD